MLYAEVSLDEIRRTPASGIRLRGEHPLAAINAPQAQRSHESPGLVPANLPALPFMQTMHFPNPVNAIIVRV